ncbi:MAG: hypothetical protein R2880_15780 [Deinococcales bacterium]
MPLRYLSITTVSLHLISWMEVFDDTQIFSPEELNHRGQAPEQISGPIPSCESQFDVDQPVDGLQQSQQQHHP